MFGYFNLLTRPELLDSVEAQLPAHRERLFPPTETLSTFLAQVMSADRSCQYIVNQAAYPQQRNQKPRLGFPICRLVGITCLTTGHCWMRRSAASKAKGT